MSRQNPVPQIDISPAREDSLPPSFDPVPWYRSRRFVIFTIAFLLSLVVTLGYVFSRPAIYQSTATVLTVANTAVDQVSSEADIQHVAIQKQVLMGSAILAEISKQMRANSDEGEQSLKVADIRQMLDVRLIESTNLVELVAEGSDPDVLPELLNTWIDVYLAARAEAVSQATGETKQVIQNELDGLDNQINAKRNELEQFRKEHDISSSEREENEVLARLKGITESLNTASEEEVKAKARLDAINKAISRGQIVVPKEDTRTLSLLEQRAQELREELEELDRNYTREFMELSPTLKVIPEKLAALEKEIKRMRGQGQSIVRADAQQEYAAAKQTAEAIRQQLDKHKTKSAEFTNRFAVHDTLQEDLVGLELLHRETQERLIQIESKYTEKYPQVDVIDRAFKPHDPIRPDYATNAMIATVSSLLFGLFCIWITEFLTRKEQPKPSINISGIPIYQDGSMPESLSHSQQKAAMLRQQQNLVLQDMGERVLLLAEVDQLLHTASTKQKLLISWLLSGVTLDEVATIQADQINLENKTVVLTGPSARTIPLHTGLQTLLADASSQLAHPSGKAFGHDDMVALLSCAIVDAGLSNPEEVTAETLRHSYIVYLVQQGIRLSELEHIVGYLTPAVQSQYRNYSPEGAGYSVDEIDLTYPSFL